MQSMGALDMGFMDKRFTWENKEEGRAYIKERLDRFLANRDWLHMFEEAKVEQLCSEASDHALIFLTND